jgi:hypothetical protein
MMRNFREVFYFILAQSHQESFVNALGKPAF